jgi:hypothetical protein
LPIILNDAVAPDSSGEGNQTTSKAVATGRICGSSKERCVTAAGPLPGIAAKYEDYIAPALRRNFQKFGDPDEHCDHRR